MNIRSIRFTKEGFDKVKKEYKDLSEKRIYAVTELQRARDLGDRSENGAYKAARSRLSSIDSRLRYLNKIIQNAEVVIPNNNGVVDIGSIVTISNQGNTYTYTIVGGHESDVINEKISMFSPVGKSLMGKKKGDVVHVRLPNAIVDYAILEVR